MSTFGGDIEGVGAEEERGLEGSRLEFLDDEMDGMGRGGQIEFDVGIEADVAVDELEFGGVTMALGDGG